MTSLIINLEPPFTMLLPFDVCESGVDRVVLQLKGLTLIVPFRLEN